jgi:transposase
MPKRLQLIGVDSVAELEGAMRQCDQVGDYQRLLAIRLASSRLLTAAQIAHQLAISRRLFFQWVKRFQQGGVEGLLRRDHGGGAPPQLPPAVQAQLVEGLQTCRWKRAKEIQHWLVYQHGIHLGLSGIYYWLERLGAVLKVPRSSHAKRDPQANAAFQQTLAEQLTQLPIPTGQKVRIWIADEHRYGLLPVSRRCWTLRGCEATTPYQTKYESAYLHSALEVDGAYAAEFWFLPEVSLDMNWFFCERLVDRDPQATHVLIQDRAGFHLDPKVHTLPKQVQIILLPPYSPELNPVEGIGDLIKDRLGNQLWPSLATMEAAISEELRPIYQNAQRVKRLVSHGWLVAQVNAIGMVYSAVSN